MARFRGTLQGQRGAASRLGSERSGLRADVNGWDLGVTVVAGVNSKTGEDEFHIYITGGSNKGLCMSSLLIGKATIENGRAVITTHSDGEQRKEEV